MQTLFLFKQTFLHFSFTSLFYSAKSMHNSRPPKQSPLKLYPRNNLITISQLILLLLIFFNTLNSKNDALVLKSLNVLMLIINIPTLLIFPYHYTKPYRIFYNLFLAVYSFAVAYYNQANSSIVLFEAQLFPLLALSLTQSKLWFVIHNFLQILYLNKYFVQQIARDLNQVPVQDFAEQFLYTSTLFVIFRMLLVFAICRSFESISKESFSAEHQSKETQRQKDFLLGFSHEFRNLTHSIVGTMKLANLEELPERVKSLLLRAEVSGEVLLQYINNILDCGKLQVNELEITPTVTRIYDIIEQLWRVSSELLKQKGLTGSIRVSKKVPSMLYIDNYRILQILFNLVSNAIKYTNKGSITITLEWLEGQTAVTKSCFEPVPFNDVNEYDEGLFEKTQAFSVFDDSLIILDANNKQIKESLLSDKKNLRTKGLLKVTVSDTGCGMSQESLSNVWDMFGKTDFGSSRRRYGAGLGLYVTKHLCQNMGGDIQVFTKLGKGSSFILCIPTKSMTKEKDEEVSTESLKMNISQRQLKAMVVDDVQFNNLILQRFFEKLNIEVTQMAEDGIDANEKYIDQIKKNESLDIVTMDIDMPRLDGKKAAEKIREYEKLNNLKPCILIMVSGDCSESDINECTDKHGKIRADGFLTLFRRRHIHENNF